MTGMIWIGANVRADGTVDARIGQMAQRARDCEMTEQIWPSQMAYRVVAYYHGGSGQGPMHYICTRTEAREMGAEILYEYPRAYGLSGICRRR